MGNFLYNFKFVSNVPDLNSVFQLCSLKLPKQKQSFVFLFHDEILGNDEVKQKQAQSSKDEA